MEQYFGSFQLIAKQVAGPALGASSGVKDNITHRNILKKLN